MRIASARGRLVVQRGNSWFDVETASAGKFSHDPQAIYERWEDFDAWASGALAGLGDELALDWVDGTSFDTPVPRPNQIIAIGLNYGRHAAESGLPIPDHPIVFAKFASSLVGHGTTVILPSDGVDWEVELVVVIGRRGHQIAPESAWDHVAGLTVGQDLSWRDVQNRGPAPQFSLGKSYPGFSPIGPEVVTPDEFTDRDDLAISCSLDGVTLQEGRTSDLIFTVPDLVSRLSEVLTLMPGDLIFTGTPAGVGATRTPPKYLVPGVLASTIEGIGELRVTLVKPTG